MPKAPILSRTALYDVLRDGTIIDLDWNLVNTSRGAMLEARSLGAFGCSAGGSLQNRDPYDESYTDRLRVSRDELYTVLGSGGDLWPRVFNTQ